MRSVLIVIFVFFYLLLGLPVLGAMWIIHKFAPAWADMAQLRLVQWAFRVIIFLSGADIEFIGEENNVKELNQLGISYNKMLERLSDAFEIQRQFTANAAHELRTPLSLMQIQLDSYNSARHPGDDEAPAALPLRPVVWLWRGHE